MSLQALLVSPGFRCALYAGNAIWFSMAFVNFTFRPHTILRQISLRPRNAPQSADSARTADVMRYLGGINLAPALIAFMRLYAVYKIYRAAHPTHDTITGEDTRMDVFALTALLAGNASQCAINFPVRGSGRWFLGRGFNLIAVLDALFSVLDAAVLIHRLRE